MTDEIGSTILRLHSIFSRSFIYRPNDLKLYPYYISVVTEVIINVDFLLMELADERSLNHRISFTDHITPYTPKKADHRYNDITSLVHFFRNATCHVNAVSRILSFDGKQKVRFVFQTGATADKPSGIPHLCKFDDDVAILMGHHVLYVRRHLQRAYDESTQYILSLPNFRLYKKLFQYKSQTFG
jgi:hypothetical protein